MIREKAKEAKRRAILAAAGKLLARRRFADVALEDVATEADVAKGTLYLYFDNKEALYLAYVAEIVAPLLQRLRARLPEAATQSAFTAVECLIREILNFARHNPALHDIMQGTTRASQEAANARIRCDLHEMLADVLRQGIRTGELRNLPPEFSAEIILATLPKLVDQFKSRGGAAAVRESIDQLLQLLAHGLIEPVKSRRALEFK